MIKNYYQILGLESNATKQEIKKAYRLYATKFHPDKQSGDKFFEERFKDIKEAYDTLIDDYSRANYDKQFSQNSNTHINYSNSQNEQDFRRREEEIKRKESELKNENVEQQKNKRIKREKDLINKIYYKDSTLEVNGLNINFPDKTRLNIFDFDSVSYNKEKKQRTKIGTLLLTSYWLIIIGIATIAFYIGFFLIVAGLILIIIAIFKGSFRVFSEISTVGIYRISLFGTYSNHEILIKARKKKTKKIVNAIEYSIRNYAT